MTHTPTCDDCEATWYRGGSLKAIVPCRLHAAAPELLEALKPLLSYAAVDQGEEWPPVVAARAAIKKAS